MGRMGTKIPIMKTTSYCLNDRTLVLYKWFGPRVSWEEEKISNIYEKSAENLPFNMNCIPMIEIKSDGNKIFPNGSNYTNPPPSPPPIKLRTIDWISLLLVFLTIESSGTGFSLTKFTGP